MPVPETQKVVQPAHQKKNWQKLALANHPAFKPRGFKSAPKIDFAAFCRCLEHARINGLRVNHFSLLGNRLHLIAEAADNQALSRGMRSLAIRLALHLKALARKIDRKIKGPVFRGRYHLSVLKTPRQVKNGLIYVMLNEVKHARGRFEHSVFSSSFLFGDWPKLKFAFPKGSAQRCRDFWLEIASLDKLLSPPTSWLGRAGWLKARGSPI